MKIYLTFFNLLIIGLFSSHVLADSVIDDLNMGLSKGSVFETPTPEVATYDDKKAGKNERLPISYSTLPPQISHAIADYLPITREDNGCLDCHDRRKLLNREWSLGKKLPMPDSHYGSFNKQGGVENVAGARYNCTQCHVPLSNAQPLVENTFAQ
jgi:cytochrome c-type protein NapB